MAPPCDVELYKSAAAARATAERRAHERRAALAVLVLRWLGDAGYCGAAERLAAEAGLSLSRVDAADNVSLLRILSEWEETQEARWGARPRLTRPAAPAGARAAGWRDGSCADGAGAWHAAQPGSHRSGSGEARPGALCVDPYSGQMAARQRRDKAAASGAGVQGKAPAAGSGGGGGGGGIGSKPAPTEAGPAGGTQQPGLFVDGRAWRRGGSGGGGGGDTNCGEACRTSGDEGADSSGCAGIRLPSGALPHTLQGELRNLAVAVAQDIIVSSPGVTWADVVGLDDAKQLLFEAVVAPARYPELFKGLLTPWRGALLYGPPGTGKTLLAKAAAAQCRATFFNVSASSLVSKWRGDSEKMVKVLFELARARAPSIIFIDEADALMGARGGEGEHEASRRLKTELLVQLDGLSTGSGSSGAPVFMLAATNMPWELDPALLRRLEKRVLVPLPPATARRDMLERLLSGRAPGAAQGARGVGGGFGSGGAGSCTRGQAVPSEGLDLDSLAAATEGFSGSDLAVLAREAAMRPLRRLLALLDAPVAESGDSATGAGAGGGTAPAAAPAARLLGPVTVGDLAAAWAATKPSAVHHADKYAAFAERFGQAL